MPEPQEESLVGECQTSQTERVHAHFDTVGTTWGSRYKGEPQRMSDLDLVLRRENVHRLVRPLMAKARSKLRVLDIGCGSGDVLDGLDRDRLCVVGIDLVPVMVARAAQTHRADQFIVADATQLPVCDTTADLITCLGVLEYIPEYEAVLASLYDKLRPGGHVIVSFPNRRSLFRMLSVLEARAESAALALRDRFGRKRRDAEASPVYDHRQWSFKEVHARLDAAGFEVAEVLFNTFGLWGLVGRSRLMLGISRWLTGFLHRRRLASSWLACTMVVLARKAERQ